MMPSTGWRLTNVRSSAHAALTAIAQGVCRFNARRASITRCALRRNCTSTHDLPTDMHGAWCRLNSAATVRTPACGHRAFSRMTSFSTHAGLRPG
jgi:hypothetical protein